MNFSRKQLVASFVLGLVLSAGVLSQVPQVQAATNSVIVFLTRLNGVIATYPANNALSVGTSTPQGGAAKLGVVLNVTDTFSKAFEVASTTGSGTATTTADLLQVTNKGCVQLTATSSATQIHLTLNTTSTTTNAGYVLWNYGVCP